MIFRHIRNIFQSQGLEPDSVVAKIATTATDGKACQSEAARHINKIFKDGEVDRKSNVQKMHFAYPDRPVNLYSSYIILLLGRTR